MVITRLRNFQIFLNIGPPTRERELQGTTFFSFELSSFMDCLGISLTLGEIIFPEAGTMRQRFEFYFLGKGRVLAPDDIQVCPGNTTRPAIRNEIAMLEVRRELP